MSKTLDQKTNHSGFPKAKEIIELTGAGTGSLALHDRRVLNILYEHAHTTAGLHADTEFEVPMASLRGSHKGGERVRDSLHRLMTVVVDIHAVIDGKPKVVKTHLFDFTESDVDETDPTASVRFGLPKKLRTVLKGSSQWGRIKAEVVMAMTSKYAVALYELVQVRSGLSKVWKEDFELQRFRELIGVPKGKLNRAPDLVRYALKPAELEVNGLSDFGVKLEPIRQGGKARGRMTGVRLAWWAKNPDEFREAQAEIKRPKVGRIARLKGTVEQIKPGQADLEDFTGEALDK